MDIKLGDYNTLSITRFTESGAYLDAGNGLEILMPRRYTNEQMHPGDEVRVFVYLDQQNRPVATTETPLARVGEFACLEVAWTNRYGAFLNWGLMKDLFVPHSEQRVKMQQGSHHVVYIYVDEPSGRIVGTSKLVPHITHNTNGLQQGDEVEIITYRRTQMGYKAIILGPNCEGLLYHNEIFQPLACGDRLKAYIKKVRDDGQIDLALQPEGRRHTEDFAVVLLRSLQDKPNHFIALNDKSDPEDIYNYFGVSKKTFKRAVGALYKERLIEITPDGICIALLP